MATFKDLQDRINLDYMNRYDLMGETKRAILNAIKTYEGARFWFNEAQTAMACSAGQTYVSVPTDFLYLDRLELTYSGASTRLIEVPFGEIRAMNAVSATGVPTHYNYHGDRFEVAIKPDSAYAVPCYYVKSLPQLSADTDSNAWTNEAANLIVHHAVLDMMMGTIIPSDGKRVAYHQNMLQIAMQELNLRNTTRFAGRLRATSF